MRRWTTTGLAGLLLAVLATAPGCIIFDPRTPEPPATGNQIDYLPQTSSANVWANLEISLNNTHAQGWVDNIGQESFTYEPDSAADTQYPGIFADWGPEQEANFINGFYNSGSTIEAKMKDDAFTPPPDVGTETVWEGVIYDLKVTDPVTSSVIEYRASAIITFTQVGSFWYITGWRDQQGESSPENPGQILSSMGVLRGLFASK